MQNLQTVDLLLLLAAVPAAALGGHAFLRGVVEVAGFGLLTLLLVVPRHGLLPRRRGLALLLAYGAFVVATTLGAV